ncbi:hypothetical protein SMGES_26110 [Serratia marcescens]|nr:hypothetical protein SMGES_26110 [Serratia marcescens]
MREVDDAQDAVHHGVAERDQRIDAAEHQTVDGLLYQRIHKESPEIMSQEAHSREFKKIVKYGKILSYTKNE